MRCENCDNEIVEEDEKCPNCGIDLNETFDSIEIKKANSFSKIISDVTNSNDLSMRMSSSFEQKNGNYKSRYREKGIIRRSKPIIIVSIILLVIGIALLVLNDNGHFESTGGKRTIMIYMVGSDLESDYYAATMDIKEMIKDKKTFSDNNILLYTGGAKKWHTDDIPNKKHALFEVTHDGLNKIEEYDISSNMMDPDNLSFFLQYGYENYNTEYYDLILWDHGAGPIYGYGYDEYNILDTMTLEEIKQALEKSPFNNNNKLELIGFDACLMSSIEVASTLSNYAEYMVASQEFEPGPGWDYTFLSKVNSKMDSLTLGKTIVDSYSSYYEKRKYIKGISISLLKLNKVNNVEKYLNDLFEDLDKNIVIDFSSVSRSRSSSKSFGRISDEEYHFDLVDLKDLIDKLPSKYYDKVVRLRGALEDLVVYQKTDLENTNGVSIYFPYENRIDFYSSMETFKKLDFAKSYYRYAANFIGKLTGEKISDWDLSSSTIESLGESIISISLPNEVIDNYSSAKYIIFEKTEDNLFTPIFTGSDIEVNGNTLNTTFKRKAIVAKDDSGNILYLTALESEKGKDFTKYHIPALISRFDEESLKIEVLAVFLDFVIDEENPEGYIATVSPATINENNTYSNYEIELKDWDSMSLVSYKYNILDEAGNYTSDWEASKEILGLDISLNKDYEISVTDLDISKNYYALFVVKDSQGNNYSSNIVEVNNK